MMPPTHEIRPINALLCFVIEGGTGDLVWFSKRQSWWRIDDARRRFAQTL